MSGLSREQIDLMDKILEQGYVYSNYSYLDFYGHIAHEIRKFYVRSIDININGFILIRTKYEDIPLGGYNETWWLEER